MRVLAIGAHYDDLELGCGGSILRHVKAGDVVEAYVATHSGYASPQGEALRNADEAAAEGRRAAAILGIDRIHEGGFPTNNLAGDEACVLSIRRILEAQTFDLVYTHWLGDVHLDHHNLARATMSAARQVPRLLAYRSNDYTAASAFNGRFYRDITAVEAQKHAAIAVFQSELARNPNLLAGTQARDRRAGQEIGVQAAECFEVIRFLT